MKSKGIDQAKGFVESNWSQTMGTGRSRLSPWLVLVVVVLLVVAGWYGWRAWFAPKPQAKPPAAVPVTTAVARQGDVPLRISVNGNVTSLSTVEVRPQVSSTVRTVHIREGQTVKPGDLLFSLDTRMDEANLARARAQLLRDQADLSDARRALSRSQELVARNFVSQSAVDTAQAKVDALEATVRADQAAIEASRVAVSYGQIRATISGRTGVINVFPGSLVLPTAASPMVTIAQIQPIAVTFTLPERQLAALREALRAGPVPVTAQPNDGNPEPVQGRITFIDNTVDPQYGTIRIKAQFDNEAQRLWPGTYARVEAVVQTLRGVVSVPPQAVVTGPEGRLVYAVQPDGTVKPLPTQMLAATADAAVVDGVPAGTRVVVEGVQNLRAGVAVRESPAAGTPATKAPAAGNGAH
ncbi:RND family efflux transporter MFP subunit [Cupriavidus gilardii J11]|uniref:RND family efflux transporter MFP subunit n=1 Tax=Cupriavidus gilardii J11 TaxID=936133 RepID=A0A562BBG1_9BURK|nr:efflux RND transporter periplasmic adaptor subunit [Cupriavidus gilardii]TWG82511.1 RND family efflux transporter MFP subunit [Cupriavidus gilardii J11]